MQPDDTRASDMMEQDPAPAATPVNAGTRAPGETKVVPLESQLSDYFGYGQRDESGPARLSLSFNSARNAAVSLAVLTTAALLLLCLFVTAAGALSVGSERSAASLNEPLLEGTPQPTTASPATSNPLALAPTVTLPAAPSGDKSLLLLYNERGFYAWNPGRRDIEVNGLAFQALTEDGQPAGYRFDGQRWAGYYPLIEENKCDLLEIVNINHPPRPSQCRGINAMLTPQQDDRMVFWLPRPGVTVFRVLWQNQEIGRCPVTPGQCEVQLP